MFTYTRLAILLTVVLGLAIVTIVFKSNQPPVQTPAVIKKISATEAEAVGVDTSSDTVVDSTGA